MRYYLKRTRNLTVFIALLLFVILVPCSYANECIKAVEGPAERLERLASEARERRANVERMIVVRDIRTSLGLEEDEDDPDTRRLEFNKVQALLVVAQSLSARIPLPDTLPGSLEPDVVIALAIQLFPDRFKTKLDELKKAESERHVVPDERVKVIAPARSGRAVVVLSLLLGEIEKLQTLIKSGIVSPQTRARLWEKLPPLAELQDVDTEGEAELGTARAVLEILPDLALWRDNYRLLRQHLEASDWNSASQISRELVVIPRPREPRGPRRNPQPRDEAPPPAAQEDDLQAGVDEPALNANEANGDEQPPLRLLDFRGNREEARFKRSQMLVQLALEQEDYKEWLKSKGLSIDSLKDVSDEQVEVLGREPCPPMTPFDELRFFYRISPSYVSRLLHLNSSFFALREKLVSFNERIHVRHKVVDKYDLVRNKHREETHRLFDWLQERGITPGVDGSYTIDEATLATIAKDQSMPSLTSREQLCSDFGVSLTSLSELLNRDGEWAKTCKGLTAVSESVRYRRITWEEQGKIRSDLEAKIKAMKAFVKLQNTRGRPALLANVREALPENLRVDSRQKSEALEDYPELREEVKSWNEIRQYYSRLRNDRDKLAEMVRSVKETIVLRNIPPSVNQLATQLQISSTRVEEFLFDNLTIDELTFYPQINSERLYHAEMRAMLLRVGSEGLTVP